MSLDQLTHHALTSLATIVKTKLPDLPDVQHMLQHPQKLETYLHSLKDSCVSFECGLYQNMGEILCEVRIDMIIKAHSESSDDLFIGQYRITEADITFDATGVKLSLHDGWRKVSGAIFEDVVEIYIGRAITTFPCFIADPKTHALMVYDIVEHLEGLRNIGHTINAETAHVLNLTAQAIENFKNGEPSEEDQHILSRYISQNPENSGQGIFQAEKAEDDLDEAFMDMFVIQKNCVSESNN